MMKPDELTQQFALKPGIVFQSVEESRSALRSIGIDHDITSYLWAKSAFGQSRLEGAYCDFSIGGLNEVRGIESLLNLHKWWQEWGPQFHEYCENPAAKPEDAELREVASMAGNWKHLRPFCLVGEYRSVYAWDLTRPNGSDEFHIVYLDYQLYNVGHYPNIFAIYEGIATGEFDDEMERDADGRAVLGP